VSVRGFYSGKTDFFYSNTLSIYPH